LEGPVASPATPSPQSICSALIVKHAPSGAPEVLLVRTRDMPDGIFRLPAGQPTTNGVVDYINLFDAVRRQTGLRVFVRQVLVTNRITTADGAVHHRVLQCLMVGLHQKVSLDGNLTAYRWASEADLSKVCAPEAAPVVQAALRTSRKPSDSGTLEFVDGQPAGVGAGV
ncbi:hypothetical protein DMH15_29520, partial [Streptomyces sp. WAC 06725]|uniref:NUDIX hydrolase n=1 Tax=Streptomyces sp. WAC 06725 TaxID=2203209 RepID=UPI001000780B